MRRFRRTLACLLASSLMATAAVAEPRTEKERSALAKQAFADGKKAYNMGAFDKAIDLWKQAYEYRDDPIFLYNIAQAYRQKGDTPKAIFFYRAYTRESPHAKNRADVEARIVELQKLASAPPPPAPEPPAPEPPPPSPTIPSPSVAPPPRIDDEALVPPPHPGRPLVVGGLVTGGVGLALVATGVVFALKSSSIQSDLEDQNRKGVPWSQALADKESEGSRDATLGAVGIAVGAAAVVTGATLWYLGARTNARAARESEPAGISVRPFATGGVVFDLTF